MADKKISQLTSLAQGDVAVTTDTLPIVDASAVETKKIAVNALVGAAAAAGLTSVDINSGTIDGTSIGSSSASTGAFTTLSASSTVSGTGFTNYFASPPAIGSTAANTGAFTTLTTSSTVTLNGGTANGVLYLNGSKVATSGTGLVFDGSNLGVGGSPGYRLDITGGTSSFAPSNSVGVIRAQNNSTTSLELHVRPASGKNGFISFTEDTVADRWVMGILAGNAGLLWGTGNPGSYSEQMRLTSTGLGIGTSSPTTKLDVNVGGTNNIKFGTASNFGIISLNGSVTTSASMGLFGGASGDADLYYQNATGGGHRFRVGTTTMAYLDSSGSLGIGTSSPGYKLDIAVGSGGGINIANTSDSNRGGRFLVTSGGTFAINSTSGIYSMTFGIDSVEKMRLDTSGNLGIGTSSPTARVHAYSGTAMKQLTVDGIGAIQTGINFANGGTTYGQIYFDNNSPYDMSVFQQYTTGSLRFGTNNTERMRLDSSGNLGLGVTPSAWNADNKAIQLPAGAIASFQTIATEYAQNCFYNTSGSWIYRNSTFANRYTQVNGQHQWHTAPSGTAGNAISFTQAMTLDASGQLALGRTSVTDLGANIRTVDMDGTSGAGFRLRANGTNILNLYAASSAVYMAAPANVPIVFETNNTERARITAGGVLCVGTTDTSPAVNNVAGISLDSANKVVSISRDSSTPLEINRKTNDGTLVRFWQDGTVEGDISVSGTTVSYNGGHLSRWSQTADNIRIPLLKGTVMSNLDQMAVWEKDGEPLPNEQLNCMKVSDVEGDVNVAGVFVNWDNDDDEFANDMNVAMTGDMIIRIAQGVVVQRGDLLMSAGDGTAKPQGDDIRRSKTIAKVTSNHVTCTYEDGSYCVPCVLMAC
jgi:hypothetical protein